MELNPREEEVMRRWHEQDPVDEWELERDARVARLQGNHNPFIHCPSLVERIVDFTGTGVQEDLPLP
jgi:endonuclease I